MKKIVIYPGTFDPITNGHLDVITRALPFFEKLIIVVSVHPHKKTLFSEEERIVLIQDSISTIPDYNKIKIVHHEGLTVDFARENNASAIIRGLRAVSDFDYEFQMATMNRKLNSDVETIFFTTQGKYFYVSSTMIKSVAQYGGDISKFVPKNIEKALKEKLLK